MTKPDDSKPSDANPSAIATVVESSKPGPLTEEAAPRKTDTTADAKQDRRKRNARLQKAIGKAVQEYATLLVALLGLWFAAQQLYESSFSSAKSFYTAYLSSAAENHEIINTRWSELEAAGATKNGYSRVDAYEAVAAQLLFACEELEATSFLPHPPFKHINPHWDGIWKEVCIKEIGRYCRYMERRFPEKSDDYTTPLRDLVNAAVTQARAGKETCEEDEPATPLPDPTADPTPPPSPT